MGDQKVDNKEWKEHWDRVRTRNANRSNCRIHTKMHRVIVEAPRSAAFTHDAASIGGRWRPRSLRWTFPIEKLEEVKSICLLHFGHTFEAQSRISPSECLDKIISCRWCICPPNYEQSWIVKSSENGVVLGRGQTLVEAIMSASS